MAGILPEYVIIVVSFLVSAFLDSLDQSYTHPTRIMGRPMPEIQFVVLITARSSERRTTSCQYHFVDISELERSFGGRDRYYMGGSLGID